MESTHNTLIVGAGMAGLSAARKLIASGQKVTIIDKGRGVGGRMATRWSDTPEGVRALYDHGAQFFTVRSQVFQAEVARWQSEGLVREWAHGFADEKGVSRTDGHPRYTVRGGMNALARELASPLGVRLQTRADSIGWDNGWQVRLENGETLTATSLILTPPVEQSLALLDAGSTRLPDEHEPGLNRSTMTPVSLSWSNSTSHRDFLNQAQCRFRVNRSPGLATTTAKEVAPRRLHRDHTRRPRVYTRPLGCSPR
jgi:predicted NAD/FAD-dependent oxidoreductase